MNESLEQKVARRPATCAKCGAMGLESRDGAEVGGFPGVTYRYCNACGHAQPPKAKRQSKKEALSDLKRGKP